MTALTRFTGRRPRDPARRDRSPAWSPRRWRPALGRAARVGRGDPATDLVDVLRLDALSDGVPLRRALGPTFAANAQLFLAPRGRAGFWHVAGTARCRSPRPPGCRLRSPARCRSTSPRPGRSTCRSWATTSHRLRDLLAADVDAAAAATTRRRRCWRRWSARAGCASTPTAAARLIGDPDAPAATTRSSFGFGDSTLGWSAQRDRPCRTAARCAPGWRRAAIRQLTSRRSARRVTLAEASAETWHRTSPARSTPPPTGWTRGRRRWRRAGSPSCGPTSPPGVLVGGYGWVEGLAPRPADAAAEPVEGEPGPLRRAADDPGFLHAPSIHQARGRRPAAQRPPRPRRRRRRPVRDHDHLRSGCGWPSASSTACAPAAASAPCSATSSSATCTSGASTHRSTTRARSRPCPAQELLPIPRPPARRPRPAPAVGRQRGPRRRPPRRRHRRTTRCDAGPLACCAGSASRSTPPPTCSRPSRCTSSPAAT